MSIALNRVAIDRNPRLDDLPTAEIESLLRPLIAHHLGVHEHDLRREVSLRDDLAADSLDVVELVTVIESALGIGIPTARLERIRTYGDLVTLVDARLRERARQDVEGVALLRTRLSSTGSHTGPALERIFWLDPYAVETVLDDVRHVAAGASLDVVVDSATPTSVLERIHQRLARFARRGVVVNVRRGLRAT